MSTEKEEFQKATLPASYRPPGAPPLQSNQAFEEWQMKVTRREIDGVGKFFYTKERLLRQVVKLTATEASLNNHGVLDNPDGSFISLYLLPGAPEVIDNDFLNIDLPLSS